MAARLTLGCCGYPDGTDPPEALRGPPAGTRRSGAPSAASPSRDPGRAALLTRRKRPSEGPSRGQAAHARCRPRALDHPAHAT